MESEELTSENFAGKCFRMYRFCSKWGANLYSALIERLKQDDEVFFMNFVEDEDGQDDYYGYVYNKTMEKSTNMRSMMTN